MISFVEMDIRQLSTLVAIADHGTFSAAARALYTVQSNVSSHIARLEKELGVTLVDRAVGGLTEEGARVVERARRILNELDDITADMSSRNAEVTGQTRIGVIGTTARWLIPRFLGELSDRHPNVRAIVQEGATSSLVPNVLTGQLNGAIVHLPVDEPELIIEPLFAEDLLLLAPDGHVLAHREVLPLAELDEVPLLLPPPGAALRRVLERAAASADITLRAQAEVDGVRLLASLAFAGFGAAIVPATAVPDWLEGSFHRITVPELPAASSHSPVDVARRRARRRWRCSRSFDRSRACTARPSSAFIPMPLPSRSAADPAARPPLTRRTPIALLSAEMSSAGSGSPRGSPGSRPATSARRSGTSTDARSCGPNSTPTTNRPASRAPAPSSSSPPPRRPEPATCRWYWCCPPPGPTSTRASRPCTPGAALPRR